MGKVIVIVGPTCSGKSTLALNLAEKISSEIISADSRQLFKYLNIGTAKPSKQQLNQIKHHLVDFLEPNELFNAGMFIEYAEKIINYLIDTNKIPIVAGGSGLYIKSLIDGIINTVDTNEELRKNLLEKKRKFGNEYLYEELKKVDGISAKKMLPQNWKRVIRALEVYYLSGKPIWQHFQEQNQKSDHTYIQFGLEWDRNVLYRRIENRVDWMIQNGLVDEIRLILEKGFSKEINALNTVGYKEIISYLENEISLERAIELIKRNTRRYAKRQLTWFKKDIRIKWFQIKGETDFILLPDIILSEIKYF